MSGILNSTIVSSDRTQLLEDDLENRRRCNGCCCTHKRFLYVLFAFLIIAAGHALAIYFLYFRCTKENNCVPLKVMSFNTWGMPATFGSEFKQERMKAIGEEIAKGEFDLYLLEELWMELDHTLIASNATTANFSITGFRQLALPTCDGRLGVEWCSGLAIVSRFPILEYEFNSYTYHGDPLKAFIDGEWFARKGVGRIRIEPLPNVTVDVFVTHTAADPDVSHGYNNSYYRIKQVRELMDTFISKSKADVVILGGDFNAGPVEHEGSPFEIVRKEMQNSIEEVLYKLKRWLLPQYTTYGNPENTFSGHKYDPIMYDYIFRRTNSPKKVSVWTSLFELPLFKTEIAKKLLSDTLIENIKAIAEDHMALDSSKDLNHNVVETKDEETSDIRSKRSVVDDDNEEMMKISLSDHEAVTSTMHIWA